MKNAVVMRLQDLAQYADFLYSKVLATLHFGIIYVENAIEPSNAAPRTGTAFSVLI